MHSLLFNKSAKPKLPKCLAEQFAKNWELIKKVNSHHIGSLESEQNLTGLIVKGQSKLRLEMDNLKKEAEGLIFANEEDKFVP